MRLKAISSISDVDSDEAIKINRDMKGTIFKPRLYTLSQCRVLSCRNQSQL